LKREDRSIEVTILTNSKDISYAGCGLPYYVGEVIKDKSALIVNTPESFSRLTGAEVLTEMEATAVDREAKTVKARSLQDGQEKEFSYDKLVIATGASPIHPNLPGMDLKNIFYMRTPEDAFALRDAIKEIPAKRAVVVGGGFIGLEVAENLAAEGIRVSVIDMAQHTLPGFDPEIAEYVENRLADEGIMVFPETKLEGVEGAGKVEKVLTSRRAMKADLAVMSIGIRPNTAFLEGSGIELNPNRTVAVNQQMQTNDPDIYAVGDCAGVTNRITGKTVWSPMGSSANIEGRRTAKNMAGENRPYPGVLGTGVCKLPGMNVGRTGLSETQAREAGFHPISAVCVVDDKAHYYPGADSFVIKMTADAETGKFLGIQVVGPGAVDKIVDIAVTALTLKADLSQLEDMDLAYAPPFSTAIHPFSQALNILENKMSGEMDSFGPQEYLEGAADGYRVIDCGMSPAIEGAQYLDVAEIHGEVPGIAKDEKVLLVCTKGKRAYLTQNRLKYYGYTNTKVLEGGLSVNEVEVSE
ncbi:MAG TPA: FAD-dependent oxidoreductase, partial [Candidatus Fusicatenibacter merdavium]|nr:FAD-dependent oxidoreductase [Candidatus Fusicatenibacter merdavium]